MERRGVGYLLPFAAFSNISIGIKRIYSRLIIMTPLSCLYYSISISEKCGVIDTVWKMSVDIGAVSGYNTNRTISGGYHEHQKTQLQAVV